MRKSVRNIYLIKDLSYKSGCPVATLKFYLRLGLLQEIGRSPSTNFRYFDDSNIMTLRKIRSLQAKHYSLKEIQKELVG